MTSPPWSLAQRFRPASLGEVEARASLRVRTDRKYLVGFEAFASLAEALARDYDALEIDGRRFCDYDSVYFDTPELTTYRQHVQGRRRRYKLRTRLYGAGPCFFEVKLKGRRGETVKRRLEVPTAAHGWLSSEARSFLDRELRAAYGVSIPGALEPVLGTAYTRLTLVARDEPERVTCDFGLSFRLEPNRSEILDGRVLVETKTERGSGAVDRQLWRLGARPLARCSKYCLGVALSRSDVRSNEFRRLLRRHFAVLVPASIALHPEALHA
jgi:hypothetical protein